MSRFLYHEKTKSDRTDYLAAKTIEYNQESSKLVVTSASGHSNSNRDLFFKDNNREEADTLLTYHAVLSFRRNPRDAQLVFFSPDSDKLVLVTTNYHLLLRNTTISMASGVVQIELLWNTLGEERAKSLPAFHASTGADNTGRFSHIGKATWFQVYLKANGDVINSLQRLLDEPEVTDNTLSTLATFVCATYSPKSICITSIPELQWHI